MMNPPPQRTVRFGLFEVDLTSCELFKAGRKIDLERQPFVVLTMLLKSRGELVTRDELRAALWPDGSFVDFNRGLNVAVKKLRDALGDSAENPRFIETLSRRGYRFIAPAEWEQEVSDDRTSTLPEARSRSWVRVCGAVGLVLASAGLGYWHGGVSGLFDIEILKPAPLTAYPGFERSPALSPDGKQVAFSWTGEKQDNADIYIKLFDMANPARLTTDPAPDDMPAWSPDGSRIAFVRNADLSNGRARIYVIPALGGPERELVELAPTSCYGDGTLS